MAFSPIAFIAPNYSDYGTYFLKAYLPGSTTPKPLAIDAAGTTTFAKLQLNIDGFFKSAGGALITPYVEGAYDAYLFETEAEADANNTAGAIRLADNITPLVDEQLRADLAAGTVDVNLDNDLSQSYEFETVQLAKNSSIVFPIGKKITIKDYATGNNSGVLFFTVVAAGTGTDDGGEYINLTTSGLQLKQNLEYPYNIKAWGAATIASTAINNAVFVTVMDFAIVNRAAGKLATEITLRGDTYNISLPVVIRTSGLKFSNGDIVQTVNVRDCMQSDGSLASSGTISYLELDNVALHISGTSNSFSGSNFRHLSGTLGWFKWHNLHTIMSGGVNGFANGYGTAAGVDGKTGGPIWELILNRIYFDETYSSSLFIPSNGGVFSLSSFDGGSTSYKLSNVHSTRIIAGTPAYRLGNGIDHAVLENVTADSCTKFAEFKVKTLIMNNCGMEEIRPPADSTQKAAFYSAADYDLILVGQQQSFDLTGFTTSFGSELQATPHSNLSHVRLNSVSSRIAGIIGGTVGTGRVLTVNGGRCSIQNNNVPGATANQALNGATINNINQQRFASTVAQTGTFNLFTIQPDGLSKVYLISMLHTFSGNSSINTFVVHTSGESGSIQGNSALLLAGIFASPATIQIVADKVEATVSGATFVTWSAVEITVL
jgi:hypothetical protein